MREGERAMPRPKTKIQRERDVTKRMAWKEFQNGCALINSYIGNIIKQQFMTPHWPTHPNTFCWENTCDLAC